MAFGDPTVHPHLGALVRVEAVLFLAALFASVGFLLLTRRIDMRGLLSNKETGRFDAGRLQLLVSTLVVAGMMVFGLKGMSEHRRIAAPAWSLVYLFGGSQGVYLIRKYLQVFPWSKGD